MGTIQKENITSEFSLVDGVKIHYLKAGSGAPLIFLHAYLSSAKTFTGLIEYFAEKYTVYAPDFPGFGESEELSGKVDLERGCKILATWIHQIELKNFILAGISMGGTNATYLAKEINQMVKGYVLIEPYYSFGTFKLSSKLLAILRVLTWVCKNIPNFLGNLIWENKSLVLAVSGLLNLVADPKEKTRPIEQRLDVISCAKFKTFWQIMDTLLKFDPDNWSSVSNKPAVLVMSDKDGSLDFTETYNGFKRLFPNLKEISLELTDHYPLEPITVRYIETHYPSLLKSIEKDLMTSNS